MTITSIPPVIPANGCHIQSKKDGQPKYDPLSRAPSLTERAMSGTSGRVERSPAYEKGAYDYLRAFYFKHGPALHFYVTCQASFAETARAFPQDGKRLNQLYAHMSSSVAAIRQILRKELQSLQASGLNEQDSEVDALLGLQHLFGNIANAPGIYSDMFMRARTEQQPVMAGKLEEALKPLLEFYEKLSTVNVHPQNAAGFLLSEIRRQYAGETA